MKEIKKTIHSSIVYICIAVFLFAGSFAIPATTSDVLGSRFFPRLTSVLMLILGVQLLLSSNVKLKKMPKEAEEEKKDRLSKPFLLTALILFLYYILVQWIGFIITSILYLVAQSVILMPDEDIRDPKKMRTPLVVAIVLPIILYFIFLKGFQIQLPVGNLF